MRRVATALLVAMPLAYLAGVQVERRSLITLSGAMLADDARLELRSVVESLANLRNDDQEEAIRILEQRLDARMLSVPVTFPLADLPPLERHSFKLGKAYRTAFPPDPDEASADLERALRVVPMPEMRECSPAIRKMLENAQAR